jgi:threonine dehydrogenase-like Zn-dependent dehydrogenase
VLARVPACGIIGSDLHFARFADQMIAAGRDSKGIGAAIKLEQGVVMGHEFIAQVVEAVEAGVDAEQWRPGARVTCIPVLLDSGAARGRHSIGYSSDYPGAYGEYVVLSASMLLAVPDHLPETIAATTEPCAAGLHAVREAKLRPGDSVLVMGAGPIGLMTLLWLKREGVRHVTVSEFAASRRELARRLGADLVLGPAVHAVAGRFQEATGGPPDVVFECVGVDGTLQQAIDLVTRRGRLMVVGVCMIPDSIKPMVAINKHVTLQFVLGYSAEEFAEALAALADGSVDTTPLVTRTLALDELPAALRSLSVPTECKIVLTFAAV